MRIAVVVSPDPQMRDFAEQLLPRHAARTIDLVRSSAGGFVFSSFSCIEDQPLQLDSQRTRCVGKFENPDWSPTYGSAAARGGRHLATLFEPGLFGVRYCS